MGLTLAFSTAACPGWELRRMVEAAASLGFSGIEFAGVAEAVGGGDGGGNVPLLGAASAMRDMLAASRLCICAVATSLALHWTDDRQWKRERAALADAVGVARELGAPVVRVFGRHAAPGESVVQAAVRIGQRLREAALAAGDVTIAVQNGGSFATPKPLWTLAEAAAEAGGHHAGVCWDAGDAALAPGPDAPGLAVHTLNSRLKLVHLWDHAGSPHAVPLGAGQVRGRLLVERLRGIGYGGCVVYAPPPGTVAPDAAGRDLEAAAAALHQWCGKTPVPAPSR